MTPTRQEQTSDPHSSDIYDTWQDFYQQMMKDGMSFFQQGVEMAQKMTPFAPANPLMSQWMDNYQDFVDRFSQQSHTRPTDGMDTGRQLYEAWLDTWTRNMEGYLQTPEFAAKSGKDLETFSDAHKKMTEMMEAYWQAMRLPSAQDMREIYQKLYMIERKLDELDKRLRTASDTPKSSAGAKKPTKG